MLKYHGCRDLVVVFQYIFSTPPPHAHMIALPTNNPYITYPIFPSNLQKLQRIFLEEEILTIANLTKVLQQEQLTHTLWDDAQNKLQEIINQCV